MTCISKNMSNITEINQKLNTIVIIKKIQKSVDNYRFIETKRIENNQNKNYSVFENKFGAESTNIEEEKQ